MPTTISRCQGKIIAIWVGKHSIRIVKKTQVLVKGLRGMYTVTNFLEVGDKVFLKTAEGPVVDSDKVQMIDSRHEHEIY
jgi:hypothetical protein